MKQITLNTLSILICLVTSSSYAVDGVLEINETCATQLGCFSGDTPGYPVTIDGSAGVSYKLTSSLIIPDINTTGIEITSPSISIDLNGFEIVGLACVGATSNCTPANGSGSGVFALNLYHSLLVKNGSIIGMGNKGISLLGDQNEISGIRIKWNFSTGAELGVNATIKNSKSFQNGLHGLNGGIASSIINNTSNGNDNKGISSGSGSTIQGNTSYSNGDDGISGGTGSLIKGNTAFENNDNGIIGFTGSTISENTSNSNGGSGIFALSNCTVQRNTVTQNIGFGLRLDASTAYRENTISGNTAGTVNGGFNMGSNFCETNDTCP